MAKMRVYEIAKELDAPSKEILDFLQEKGVEAKTASSNIDDDIIAMVRGKFSTKAKSEKEELKKEEPKKEASEKPVKKQEEKIPAAPSAKP